MCRFTHISLALILSLASYPAAADWLKTNDGALIETQGPWTVRRNVVVFKLPNGTLASLRLREVDLERSRTATEEAVTEKAVRTLAPPAPSTPAGASGKAVASVTMKDIPKAVPEAVAPSEEVHPEGGQPGRYEAVQVTDWSPGESTGGTEIRGTLHNTSSRIVLGIRVDAKLLDADGKVVATAKAFLSKDSLAPTTTTDFRALFPGVYDYDQPHFEVHSTEVKIGCAPPPRDTGK